MTMSAQEILWYWFTDVYTILQLSCPLQYQLYKRLERDINISRVCGTLYKPYVDMTETLYHVYDMMFLLPARLSFGGIVFLSICRFKLISS